MLKPAGTLSFANGNLSAAVVSGGDATGASFAAASLSGRPIRGEPGGSAGAAAGAAAFGGLAGCCAAAVHVNAPRKAPASNRLRGDKQIFMVVILPYVEALSLRGRARCQRRGPPRGQSLKYFSIDAQWPTTQDGMAGMHASLRSRKGLARQLGTPFRARQPGLPMLPCAIPGPSNHPGMRTGRASVFCGGN